MKKGLLTELLLPMEVFRVNVSMHTELPAVNSCELLRLSHCVQSLSATTPIQFNYKMSVDIAWSSHVQPSKGLVTFKDDASLHVLWYVLIM